MLLNSVIGLVNLHGGGNFSRFGKRFGYALESSAAASLNVWFGLFRLVRGLLVRIALWETLLASEIVNVEEGEEEVSEVNVDEDLTTLKFNALVPPLKLELIFGWFN